MAVTVVFDQIGPSATAPAEADWQAVLGDAVRDPGELARLLGLPAETTAEAEAAAQRFPMLVPRTYLARIRPGDPHDPLLAQVLPRAAELAEAPGFAPDPLDEAATLCGPGLLRKYKGRLLIVTTGACGVHCRFCFRRHFHCPAAEDGQLLERIAAEKSMEEVVLSGGDPLIMSDSHLSHFAARLAEIPHLRRLRIHTRLPIVIPQRVTHALLAWLRGTRLTTVVVVHVNHPAEIDQDVADALARMVDAGVPVLSQGVLLRGVNDDADVLAELYGRLIDLRVMPYYLHQLDRVAGAAHFEVPVARGVRLMRQLRARLPGYAVPRYVRDTPGGTGKRVLA
jgi:EF-P beta-lysylation protein EpmB